MLKIIDKVPSNLAFWGSQMKPFFSICTQFCYVFVTPLGCWTFLWISVPATRHHVFPDGRRLLASFPVYWTITLLHPTEKFFPVCRSVKQEGLLSVPHLPQDYAQAVDVSFAIILLFTKHLGCKVKRGSGESTSNVFLFFRRANVTDLDRVLL